MKNTAFFYLTSLYSRLPPIPIRFVFLSGRQTEFCSASYAARFICRNGHPASLAFFLGGLYVLSLGLVAKIPEKPWEF